MFLPFFKPLLLRALFAFALDKVVSRFSFKRKSPRYVPILAVLTVFFLIIASPLVLVTIRLSSTIRNLSQSGFTDSPLFGSLKDLAGKVEAKVHQLLHTLNIPTENLTNAGDFLTNAGTWTLTTLGSLVA